jgi:hypothetical protein
LYITYLKETLELELILVIVKLITIDSLLQTLENDISLEILDFIAEPTQIVRIPTTKTLEIVLIEVNANEPFRGFVHFDYKI